MLYPSKIYKIYRDKEDLYSIGKWHELGNGYKFLSFRYVFEDWNYERYPSCKASKEAMLQRLRKLMK